MRKHATFQPVAGGDVAVASEDGFDDLGEGFVLEDVVVAAATEERHPRDDGKAEAGSLTAVGEVGIERDEIAAQPIAMKFQLLSKITRSRTCPSLSRRVAVIILIVSRSPLDPSSSRSA